MYNSYNLNSMPNAFARPVAFPQRYVTPNPRMSSLFGRYPAVNSKITFSSILNGTSKTLGVINQAIPVFYQIKPIWNNARTMFRVIRGLNSNDISNSKNMNTTKTSTISQKKEQTNAPKFFV